MLIISEKTSGSKMLKKARSFREDIKVLIKRRPSSSSQHGQSPGTGKPKIQVTRAGSLGDGHDDVSDSVLSLLTYEVLHGKIGSLHMQKQKRRSASQ